MLRILEEDIIPILVIMLVGYICGKFKFFDDDQRQGLNKLVLDIALPAALFISIAKATRTMFEKDIVLTVISVVGVMGMFLLSYWLDRVMFHRTIQEAAVCAMSAGSPTIGFLGFAVLDPIFGNTVTTNLVIGIVAIVANAFTIPVGLVLVDKGQALDRKKAADKQKLTKKKPVKVDETVINTPDGAPVTDEEAAALKRHGIDREIDMARALLHNDAAKRKVNDSGWAAVLRALEKPVAAAPLLAMILVLVGIRIPATWAPTFDLIAKANAGVAVLVTGVTLSTVKFSIDKEILWNTFFRLLLTPAVIVAAAYLCGMGSEPTKIAMLCIATALPPAFSGIIISSRYNIYVKDSTSTAAVSMVGFAFTCLFWLWILPIIASLVH